ncbi:DJ-1/PfpI family protein [Bradyrhizobium sp. 2TAF24]|uniref:DJ-1/PfpI family protein n=1 Tax=Bradyrhizobium sp. 2TAF24 TaxID=3233011 RepID=UPI003F8E384E
MKFAFLLYDGMTALDLIGPHEILSRLPGVEAVRVAKHAGPIHTDTSMTLTADAGFTDVRRADLLLVPGAGNATAMQDDPATLDWVRRIDTTTRFTTSVCTGSLILGAAGLLQGVRATSHWAALDRLTAFGATPVSARMVEDGKIVTGAGVAAGIDMALALAARISGERVARTLQLAIEYDPDPPFDSGHPAKADPAHVTALRALMSAAFVPPPLATAADA